nr:MAG TPA: hypothetical protein [Caudoviricetes sp.]
MNKNIKRLIGDSVKPFFKEKINKKNPSINFRENI